MYKKQYKWCIPVNIGAFQFLFGVSVHSNFSMDRRGSRLQCVHSTTERPRQLLDELQMQ